MIANVKRRKRVPDTSTPNGAAFHQLSKSSSLNWFQKGRLLQETIKGSFQIKDTTARRELLINQAKALDCSANTVRRFSAMTTFAEKLAKIGLLEEASEAGQMSCAKLEIVARISNLSQTAGRKLILELKNGPSPSLRKLREQYSELQDTTDKPLRPSLIAQKSIKLDVIKILRIISKQRDVVAPSKRLARPSSRFFSFFTVDGLIGRHQKDWFEPEAGVLVLRSREAANRSTLLTALAQCCYVGTFFEVIWIVGRHDDFPVGAAHDESKDKIQSFIRDISILDAKNVGIIEITGTTSKVRHTPSAGAVPDRRALRSQSLSQEFFTLV